ncbi:MAG: imidazole glycerol phosphate synthase subunit HisH [Acidobacteriota bacterium]|nr:MAG: imidazole glycerol phosphate synthase subunit HisH [Acidobacteriota bacterium]
MKRVAIVDSGCANVASVSFALERLGASPEVTFETKAIGAATHVVLPGVGTAMSFMTRMRERELTECLRSLRQPCLGICLGMQAMFERSEEGDTETLGIFPGRIARLPAGDGLTIPHMGWNRLAFDAGSTHPLLEGIDDGAHVYFVHSYYAVVSERTIATTRHGVPMSAIAARDNFYGCQFHPERSGHTGARLLQNFLSLS